MADKKPIERKIIHEGSIYIDDSYFISAAQCVKWGIAHKILSD